MSRPTCQVFRLGRVPYQEAWDLQEAWAREIAAGSREPALLLLEHPHTYTFGRRGQQDNLLWGAEELARRGINVYWVDRGGDVTYHGPGQLVGYPLLPLAPVGLGKTAEADEDGRPLPHADYVGYIRKLEQALVLALHRLGVESKPLKGLTGVWLEPDAAGQPAKIAAIGVKVDARGVSRHGFALNVAPDMSYWEGIIGCGLKDAPVASLADVLNPPPTIESVIDRVVEAFGEVFNFDMVESRDG